MTPKSSKHINIDDILEELYRAGTHKMYCTEPHHFRSIANVEQQLKDLISNEIIGEDVDPDQATTDRMFNNMIGVNIAKKEQRARLTDLFKGDKE